MVSARAIIDLAMASNDDAVKSIRQRGGKIMSQPGENSGLRFAYIAAPDGVIIELLAYGGKWATLLGAP